MAISNFRVVLAGGGTGGHVIPAIAIAHEVVARGGEARFIGTADRIEARLVPDAGFGIDFIKVKPLAGGGLPRMAIGAAAAPLSVMRSMKLLGEIGPSVVMGVGGYVAGPVVLGAKLMGIPTALLEQNATVGLANRILARLVKKAFVSYEETMAFFPGRRVVFSGNPVKRSILEASAKKQIRGPTERVRILVMGGSQGAATIDARVPQAMGQANLAGKVQVLHQCAKGRQEEVSRAYRDAGIAARVVDFIDDTAGEFARTDLVVARSGATTVAELTVMGLPAIFLPYPHHKDRQQEKNAAAMVQCNAAVILDETTTGVEELAQSIADLALDDARRQAAADACAGLGKRDAAITIVDGLLALVEGR